MHLNTKNMFINRTKNIPYVLKECIQTSQSYDEMDVKGITTPPVSLCHGAHRCNKMMQLE